MFNEVFNVIIKCICVCVSCFISSSVNEKRVQLDIYRLGLYDRQRAFYSSTVARLTMIECDLLISSFLLWVTISKKYYLHLFI